MLVVNVLSASHVQAQVWRLMVFDDIQAYEVTAYCATRHGAHSFSLSFESVTWPLLLSSFWSLYIQSLSASSQPHTPQL